MDCDITKLTTAIEDCYIGKKESLTVKLATERGWSGFRIFPNGNLWALNPDGKGEHVPDYAGRLRGAAPELLALLEECDEYLSPNPQNYIGHGSILHTKMRDLIAKAKAQ